MDLQTISQFYAQEPSQRDQAPATAYAVAMERAEAGRGEVPDTLRCPYPLDSTAPAHVRVLAPIAATAHAVRTALVAWTQTGDRVLVRDRLKRNNPASVVVHAQANGTRALLAGDLEDAPADFGWPAVGAEQHNHDAEPVQLLKVPHHGSSTADNPGPWQFVENSADLVLAPNSSNRLPTPDDVDRLLARGTLWQAARTNTPDWGADEFSNRVGTPGEIGAVVARWGPGDTAWRLETMGEGFRRPDPTQTAAP